MRLFLEVLTELTSPPQGAGDEVRERSRAVRNAHERIVDAIVAGDVSLARHRMQSHLVAMGKFLEGPDSPIGPGAAESATVVA